MWDKWKHDIFRAIVLFAVVAVAALIINWVRTPILLASAENGLISRARYSMLKGVDIIDSWSHGGWPGESTISTEENGNGTSVSSGISEVIRIDTEQAYEMFESGDCIFFDAREPEYYEESHIPGAYNWPYTEFDRYHELYRDMLSPDDCIVLYCSNDACDESGVVASGLVYEYYSNVYRYLDGFDEWLFRGYPEEWNSDDE